MAIDYNVIGERLKAARIEKGFTQEQIAEKLDVSIAFLSRIETGNSHINLRRLDEICNILGVSQGSILEGTSEESGTYLNKEFSDLLKNCPPEKMKLIYKVAKIIIDE